MPAVFANWFGLNVPLWISLEQRDSQIKNVESVAEPVPDGLLHSQSPM